MAEEKQDDLPPPPPRGGAVSLSRLPKRKTPGISSPRMMKSLLASSYALRELPHKQVLRYQLAVAGFLEKVRNSRTATLIP